MKTKNDSGQVIYICPHCKKTWSVVALDDYQYHLKVWIKELESELNETFMPTGAT